MPITLVGSATGGQNGNTCSVTVADLTGLQDGDFLVAQVAQDADLAGWALTGWTKYDERLTTTGRDATSAWLTKVASGESGTWDFYNPSNTEKVVIVTAWRGVDTSNPIVGTPSFNSGTNSITPTCQTQTVAEDAMVLTGVSLHSPDAAPKVSVYGAPSGWTLAGSRSFDNNDNVDAAIAYQSVSGSGTPTAGAWTNTGSSDVDSEWHVRAIALRPSGPFLGSTLKAYSGGWVEGKLKRYNGSDWEAAQVQRWNGSTWEDVP